MSAIITSKTSNPYKNLALEKFLVENNDGTPVLFIWKNQNTIVIGKNQNVYEECNLDIVEKNSIRIARRLTGGGAVYHHLGNLNFSFIAPKHIFDINRQLNVILRALKNHGIYAEFSGRNDLLCEGKKFSGNAFLLSDTSLHHGTLLIKEDMDTIQQVLNVKPSKLASKGVKSIKARMINLSEINPNISLPNVISSLIASFEEEYGPSEEQEINENFYSNYIDFFSSKEWIFGKSPTYNLYKEGRSAFGQLDFYLLIQENIIKEVKIYTDSLDELLSTDLEKLLSGAKFSPTPIKKILDTTRFSSSEITSILF